MLQVPTLVRVQTSKDRNIALPSMRECLSQLCLCLEAGDALLRILDLESRPTTCESAQKAFRVNLDKSLIITMATQQPAEHRSEEDPVFDPFRRHDQYGLEGATKQSILEYLRLAFMAVTILPLKILGCIACLIGCYLVCKLSFLVPTQHRAAWVVSCGKVFVRMELFCLGFIFVKWQKVPDTRPQHIREGAKVAGIVSNHCSWADILVHMSRAFPSFVARASTKNLLWVGLIR